MPDRFQILLRRRQNTYEGNNVVVQCNPLTGYAEYVPGTVDNTTPFAGIVPVGGWYDFTPFIEGSEKISFTWDKVNSGNSSNSQTNQDGSNYDKGLSSDLLFIDSAFQFIKDWLLTSECDILNCVEVKIIDLIARSGDPDPTGSYRTFEIKSDNLDYAPIDEPCQFHIKLREQDSTWHCIHKTFIWDNHQHWFEESQVKQHPCFMTCIEPRPRLMSSARMALLLIWNSFGGILPFLTGVFGFLVKKLVNDTGSSDIYAHARKIMNANRFVDAPLIRTYIENVADKCQMTFDTIFDEGQEWENLCLYDPQAGYMHEREDDNFIEPTKLFYHFDNRRLITIAELLDKLKAVFAAEWYVTPNNKIVFKYKKDLINLTPIYDFTLPGAEPIYELRYTFNGEKKPAYGRYQYQDDGSDLASQEMSTLYSDIIDYDGPANNPMLEGERLKNFEFAPTGFVRDGRAQDYLKLLINDGKLGAIILVIILTVVVVALFAGVLSALAGAALAGIFWAWIGQISVNASKLRQEFVVSPHYTGSVRLTSEQTLTPRLILWDGVTMQRAKAVADVGLPAPNTFYNPDAVPYNVRNDISKNNDENQPIYNYNLYFDGDFQGNLFPRFHDVIDNPLKSLETHQEVKWSVDLCENMLNLFGVFENQYAQIGKIVKVEKRDNYDVYARIGNINVDYDSNKIILKGTIIRRRTLPGTGYETTIPTAPVESGEIIDTYRDIIPEEENICLKWKNDSLESVTELMYVDCEGALIQNVTLAPGETFCSFGIISLGIGGNIVATEICETESPSPSGPIECFNFQNISVKDAINVSYTDCDGNLVTGATIPAQSVFCAAGIVDYGSCGLIVNTGSCSECDESGDTNLLRWK